jgi:hypothetical protein
MHLLHRFSRQIALDGMRSAANNPALIKKSTRDKTA